MNKSFIYFWFKSYKDPRQGLGVVLSALSDSSPLIDSKVNLVLGIDGRVDKSYMIRKCGISSLKEVQKAISAVLPSFSEKDKSLVEAVIEIMQEVIAMSRCERDARSYVEEYSRQYCIPIEVSKVWDFTQLSRNSDCESIRFMKRAGVIVVLNAYGDVAFVAKTDDLAKPLCEVADINKFFKATGADNGTLPFHYFFAAVREGREYEAASLQDYLNQKTNPIWKTVEEFPHQSETNSNSINN